MSFFVGILTLNLSLFIITLSLGSKGYGVENYRKYFELIKWFFLSFILLFFGFLLGLPILPSNQLEGIWLLFGLLVFIILFVGVIILIFYMIKLLSYLFEKEIQRIKVNWRKLCRRNKKETRRGLKDRK